MINPENYWITLGTLGLDRAHGLSIVDEGDAKYLWVVDNGGESLKNQHLAEWLFLK